LTGLVTVDGDLALRTAQGRGQGFAAGRAAAHRQLANPAVVIAALVQNFLVLGVRQLNLVIGYGAQRSHLHGAAVAKLVPKLLDHQAALCGACVLMQGKPPVVLGVLEVYEVQCDSRVLLAALIVLFQDFRTAHARALQVGPSLCCGHFAVRHDADTHFAVSMLHVCAA